MYPHRIRLRGPWQCTPLTRVGGETPPEPLRIRMPSLWDGVLDDFRGRVRFERRFGYPGRIDEHERVWLTFAEVVGVAAVELNGHKLGAGESGAFEYEVTPLLEPRNGLQVDVESVDRVGGLSGEVALEIRCAAFLRGLSATWADRRLRLEGEVVGTGDQALEVYVLADRSNVGYGVVQAGESFVVETDELSDSHQGVHVQLVSGASIWYGIDVVAVGNPGT